jgi:hypothetical protein
VACIYMHLHITSSLPFVAALMHAARDCSQLPQPLPNLSLRAVSARRTSEISDRLRQACPSTWSAEPCRSDNCSKYLRWQPSHYLLYLYQLSHLIAVIIWKAFTCISYLYVCHVKSESRSEGGPWESTIG